MNIRPSSKGFITGWIKFCFMDNNNNNNEYKSNIDHSDDDDDRDITIMDIADRSGDNGEIGRENIDKNDNIQWFNCSEAADKGEAFPITFGKKEIFIFILI
jgi:hypothetical protein